MWRDKHQNLQFLSKISRPICLVDSVHRASAKSGEIFSLVQILSSSGLLRVLRVDVIEPQRRRRAPRKKNWAVAISGRERGNRMDIPHQHCKFKLFKHFNLDDLNENQCENNSYRQIEGSFPHKKYLIFLTACLYFLLIYIKYWYTY